MTPERMALITATEMLDKREAPRQAARQAVSRDRPQCQLEGCCNPIAPRGVKYCGRLCKNEQARRKYRAKNNLNLNGDPRR